MINLQSLMNLLLIPKLVAIEPFSILDEWSGLISYEEMSKLICSNEPNWAKSDIELQIESKVLLTKLSERFCRSCPYATTPDDFRHQPAFVIMPAGDVTQIVGIVFKLGNNGTTFFTFPYDYLELWMSWLKIQKEEIMEFSDFYW